MQDLHLQCICGPDGGFLATASPTLRFLRMEGLPDFKVRALLSQELNGTRHVFQVGCALAALAPGAGLVHVLFWLVYQTEELICSSKVASAFCCDGCTAPHSHAGPLRPCM